MRKNWLIVIFAALLISLSWALTDNLDLLLKYQWISAKQTTSKYDGKTISKVFEQDMHYENYNSFALEVDYFLNKKTEDFRVAVISGIDYVPEPSFGANKGKGVAYTDTYYGLKGYWKDFFVGFANQVPASIKGSSTEYHLTNYDRQTRGDVDYYGILDRRYPAMRYFIGYSAGNIEYELSTQKVEYQGRLKTVVKNTFPVSDTVSEIADVRYFFDETKLSVGWKF